MIRLNDDFIICSRHRREETVKINSVSSSGLRGHCLGQRLHVSVRLVYLISKINPTFSVHDLHSRDVVIGVEVCGRGVL